MHLLPVPNIEGVIGDDNFSSLLNVLFRFPVKMFSQNASLMLDAVMVFTNEEINVDILKISRNKKKSKKVKHQNFNYTENDSPSRGKVLSTTCMIFMNIVLRKF